MALTALTGCKSGFKAPGADWFAWNKPKPSASSLASVPKKPSVGALPTPTATTGGGASPYGQTGYAKTATGQPGQSGYGMGGSNGAATGYQTGPYGTSSAGGYPAASNGLTSAPPAAGGTGSPYRSPYQAAQGGTAEYDASGASYGTADARGVAGYETDPYRRAGDTNGGGQVSSPYGGNQTMGNGGQSSGSNPNMSYPPAQNPYSTGSYGGSGTSGYQQPASYQQGQGSQPTASHAYAGDTGGSGYPATYSPSSTGSSSGSGYRPGSTSRDTGALSGTTSTNSSYSTGGYPMTSGAPATATQPWSGGSGGQYPTY